MYVTNKQLVDLMVPVLHTACERWRDYIREAIAMGEGIALDERDLNAAAWWAARYGHIKCLRLLLVAGMSQAGIDEAARWASAQGHIECLKALIAAGLSQTGIDIAAGWARWEKDFECQKLLEEAKAKEE